jgi:CheY-like chemotaxis protein
MNPVVIKTILIVDDDYDDLLIFFDAVSEIDARLQCKAMSNGFDAMRSLSANQSVLPDLIFLDMNMPKLTGKAFLSEIKQSANLQHIPVIIYTSSRFQKDIDDTRKLGAAYYLNKPNGYLKLKTALREILSLNMQSAFQGAGEGRYIL